MSVVIFPQMYTRPFTGAMHTIAVPSGVDLLTGLVSYWKLDEASGQAADSHGVNTGNPTDIIYGTPGIINDAFEFNGATSYLDCGDHASLTFADALSVSVWLKKDIDIDWAGIVEKGEGSGGAYLLRADNTGKVMLRVFTAASSVQVLSPGVLNTGSFYHIVGVYDKSTVGIYINGVHTGGPVNTEDIPVTAHNLFIGFDDFNVARKIDGILDEIGIWSTALNQEQVSALYNGGSGLAYPFS